MSTSVLADPQSVPPPPWRQSRYAPAAFLKCNVRSGTIADAFGQRMILSSPELMAALYGALTHEVGDAAAEILHKVGAGCGAADMRAFAARATDEFGVELPKVHMGVALQTWWWRWSATGWGAAAFDLQHAAQRLVRIELQNGVRRPEPLAGQLLSGLFAGAFGQLTGRAVGCIAVQDLSAGADGWRFLVTTPGRAASAIAWRDAGVPLREIEDRLMAPHSTATPKGRRS